MKDTDKALSSFQDAYSDMDAIIFSWSGSFQDDMDARKDEIEEFIRFVHDTYGMEVGLISNESRGETDDAADSEELGIDFTIGEVENILDVLQSLARKYEKVFFVSDIRAELAAVNQSGAFTVGYKASSISADDLSGVGPNYIVDSLDELQQILALELM
jgi:phosphoglycolate phosphatase-like HAD superfamily hydrolase